MNPRKILPALFVTILSLSCSTPSQTVDTGARSGVVPLVGDYKVHRYTLDNGLRLLVVEDRSSPTFAYQTWYRVGSRDEVPGRTGLAHLFEHMMFKGTKRHPEGDFFRILDGDGAEDENAFTTHDYTAYVESLPKDKLETIAQLESDRMVNLVVNEKSFRTELQVVQNERRYRNENNPEGTIYQTLFETAFKKHPYHWPVVGYQRDLERMSAQDAVDFYHSYYSPNHATVVVAGDLDPDHVYSVIKRYYGEIPGQSSPIHTTPGEPPQRSIRRKTLKLNIQVEKLMMGYHVPGVLGEDVPALSIAQAVLTGGKSSRLYRALVDTGICSSVDSFNLEDRDPSLLVINANLQKGKRAIEAQKIVFRELARLSARPITTDELERARNYYSFAFYQGLDSNGEIASFLGRYETIANDFQLGIQQYQRVLAVNPPDVQGVVKRYLVPTNSTVISGVPK